MVIVNYCQNLCGVCELLSKNVWVTVLWIAAKIIVGNSFCGSVWCTCIYLVYNIYIECVKNCVIFSPAGKWDNVHVYR